MEKAQIIGVLIIAVGIFDIVALPGILRSAWEIRGEVNPNQKILIMSSRVLGALMIILGLLIILRVIPV